MDLEFLALGKMEEELGLGDDILDEEVVDAGGANVEEADFEEGMAKLVQEGRLGGGVAGKGEVENGQRVK